MARTHRSAGTGRSSSGRPGSAASPRRRLRRHIALAALVLVLLALAGYGAVSLPYAAGWAGTPGTIKVTVCRDEGSSDAPSYHCSGTFTSNDGFVTDEHATATVGSRADGRTIKVRRSGTGGYHPLGFVPVAESVAALLMGGVPLLAALLTRRKRPGRPRTLSLRKRPGRPRTARRVAPAGRRTEKLK